MTPTSTRTQPHPASPRKSGQPTRPRLGTTSTPRLGSRDLALTSLRTLTIPCLLAGTLRRPVPVSPCACSEIPAGACLSPLKEIDRQMQNLLSTTRDDHSSWASSCSCGPRLLANRPPGGDQAHRHPNSLPSAPPSRPRRPCATGSCRSAPSSTPEMPRRSTSGCGTSSTTQSWKQIQEKTDAWNSLPLEKFPTAEARKFVDQWGGTTKLLRIGSRRQSCDWSYPLAEQKAADHRDAAARLPVHEAVGAAAPAQGQGRDGRARLRPGHRHHRDGHRLRPARRRWAVPDQQPGGHRDLRVMLDRVEELISQPEPPISTGP